MTPPVGLALLDRIQAQMRVVARRQYEAALKIDPELKDAQAALKKLS